MENGDIARIIDESCREIQGISLTKRYEQIKIIGMVLNKLLFKLEVAYSNIECALL